MIPVPTWRPDENCEVLTKHSFKNSFAQAATSVSCAAGSRNPSHQLSFNGIKTYNKLCVAGVLNLLLFRCFIRFIHCSIVVNALLSATTCTTGVTPCCLVIRLFLCLTGEEDGEKTTGSASDPGRQSSVPHYDVTLEGLQLALIDRHNFSGANSSKEYFNYYQIRVFDLVCYAI